MEFYLSSESDLTKASELKSQGWKKKKRLSNECI